MADIEARCKLLEQENDELRDKIVRLEEMLGVTFDAPAFLELTSCEAVLFGVLLNRECVTKTLAMDAIYGDRPDADVAEEKIVDVWICKIRAKLEPWGIEIETNWGQGYFMTPAMKTKARALIDEHAAQEAA